jgi:nitrite reductase (NO-forming)
VVAAQAQATRSFRVALAFVLAAVVTSVVPHDTGAWLPLHLLLAGALVVAISGATLFFAVTWSAAPAPDDRTVASQRWTTAVGAGGIAAVRELDAPVALLAVAGAAFVVGLLLLAGLLAVTVRRGVQRRFDVAASWYLAAVACGLAGAGLGIAMGADAGSVAHLRNAHVVLNLLGLVGLVVGGTIPFFVATGARVKLSPRATAGPLAALLAWQAVAVAITAASLAAGHPGVAAGGLAAYAAGIAALVGTLPALGAKQLRWAGPRLVQLLAGVTWWSVGVVAAAVASATGHAPLSERTVVVIAVFGYGQVLWASLAYLLPVLRAGGHERLSAGFATTRSWVALAAANLGGLALVAGLPKVAAGLVAVWVLDAGGRVARLSRGGSAAPAAGPSPGSTG